MTHCTWKDSYIHSNITHWQLQGEPDEPDSEDEPPPAEDLDYYDWQVLAGALYQTHP